MLELARAKVPGADFHLGELDALPLADASVDLVVCALALTHVPGLSSRDSRSQAPPTPPDVTVGPSEDWPWTLLSLVPAAAQAAWEVPAVIMWDFERMDGARL